jgi:hypothetical protein
MDTQVVPVTGIRSAMMSILIQNKSIDIMRLHLSMASALQDLVTHPIRRYPVGEIE